MEIHGERLVLSPWRDGDVEALARHADDREVWRNLRDVFPHPYTERDAREWIHLNQLEEGLGIPPSNLAIRIDDAAVGGVGLTPQEDVHSATAELGYWLGRSLWGKGLATEAVALFVDYAFEHFEFDRLEAGVFEWNPASCRVLEKTGFELEGRLRKNVTKDGTSLDTLMYGRLR